MFDTTDEIKKDAISRHVQGEINMFDFCFRKLTAGLEKIGGNERRMVHECYLLHARNLMDFLWPPLSSKPDDVFAKCFTNFNIDNSERVDHIRKRINKQLSHITFNRSSKEQEDLLSKTREMHQDIMSTLEKYNNACTDKEYKLKIPN